MNEVDLHEEDENEPSSSTTEQPPQTRAYTHTHIKISTPKLMQLKLTKSRRPVHSSQHTR
jgi:hypothetical protein